MADETDVSTNISQDKRYKRKRKKNFLVNARKYGKKGCYGRGSELDSDTYQYFVRIMEVYKEGFPGEEEKLLFVNNVFQQTEDREITCAKNQLGCRVIQMLLPFVSDEFLVKYIDIFKLDLRPLCSDRFASHVLQTLLEVSCTKSLDTNINETTKEKCHSFTITISKFLLNNLEDYVWDTYGNHIIRTVFKSLVQLPPDDNPKIGTAEKKIMDVPEEYEMIVKDYAQRLIVWPQFCDLPYSEITSGLLQILLRALIKIDTQQLKIYIKKLLRESFIITKEENNGEEKAKKLSDIFMSKPAMMLLELVLELAPPKLFTKVYTKCFVNNLVTLATARSTNFCIQKLLGHATNKVEFEAMLDELSEDLWSILDAGHSGVIFTLAQTSKRLSVKQGNFTQSIMKALNCYEPEEHQNKIVLCLCKLSKFEDLSKDTVDLDKAKLNLHGTLIVQTMLEFNKPIKIVNSILEMSNLEVKNLYLNSMGSHICDTFMKSEFIGEKSREKLIRKLQGTFQDLASTKYGSRSFEAIWAAANLKHKMNIMKELSYKDAAWSNSTFGKIIASKVNLQLYKKNNEEWKNFINNKNCNVKKDTV